MTQEEKKFLLEELCSKLPYGVKLDTPDGVDTLGNVDTNEGWINASYDVDEVKPYLRSMSSMSEEEEQMRIIYERDIMSQGFGAVRIYMSRYIDWLNSKHFDWHTDGNNKTLIEKGLALEAPEGMY